jgi:hypothetical protein
VQSHQAIRDQWQSTSCKTRGVHEMGLHEITWLLCDFSKCLLFNDDIPNSHPVSKQMSTRLLLGTDLPQSDERDLSLLRKPLQEPLPYWMANAVPFGT